MRTQLPVTTLIVEITEENTRLVDPTFPLKRKSENCFPNNFVTLEILLHYLIPLLLF